MWYVNQGMERKTVTHLLPLNRYLCHEVVPERSSRWILRSWCGEKRSLEQEREEGFRSVVRCGVRYCYALLYRIPHQYYFDDLRLESENWVVSKRELQS